MSVTPSGATSPDENLKRRPPRAAIVAGVLALALVGWLLFGPRSVPRNIIPVSGRIEGDESTIAARTSGRVQQITVREGDTVKKNQLLAVLDDDQVRDREAQAQASLEQAEARAKSSKEQIAILQESLAQSRLAVGQAELDTSGRVQQAQQQVTFAEAGVDQANARLHAAEEGVRAAHAQFEQSRIAVGQARLDARGHVEQAEQQVAAAEAQRAQAWAQYQQATHDDVRYHKLLVEDEVSERDAQNYHTTAVAQYEVWRAAQKEVSAARGALLTARASLSNPPIRALNMRAVHAQQIQAERELEAARASVRQAEAQRQQSASSLTATRALLSNPAVRTSQQLAVERQIVAARADLAAAQASAREARGKLAEARADRNELRIFAPFDGTIATRVAEPGEVVVDGTAILTIIDMNALYLRAFIPEEDIGRVKLQQSCRVFLDSDPRTPLDAYVSRVDPKMSFTPENTYFRSDRVKQVVGVKLLLRAANGSAKPGMPADGEVLVEGEWPTREPWR